MATALHKEITAFSETGNTCSVLAAGSMLLLLLRDPAAMRQVRPRILAVLAALDTLAALFDLSAGIPSINYATNKTLFVVFAHLLATPFQLASWMWTALIAFHVWFVLRFDIVANSTAEKRAEKGYLAFLCVAVFCLYFPLSIYFLLIEDDPAIEAGDQIGHRRHARMFLVYVCLVWAAMLVLTVLIHIGVEARDDSAGLYRRQMRLFLFGFLVLTVQPLINLFLLQSATVSTYFYDFGYEFSYWLGAFNAAVWGRQSGRLCLHRTYYCVCPHAAADLALAAPDLALPLMDRRSSTGRASARLSTSFFRSSAPLHPARTGSPRRRGASVAAAANAPTRSSAPSHTTHPDDLTSAAASARTVSAAEVKREWEQSQSLLARKQWSAGAGALRPMLEDERYSRRLRDDEHKLVAQHLSYALYMMAHAQTIQGERSADGTSSAALLEEVLQLVKAFEISFAGRIRTAADGRGPGKETCCVSFPGKYMEEWTDLVRDGHWDGSIACVFFPSGSPNFGAHVPDPACKGKCYCHKLYGERKEWGCKWFVRWMANVRAAVAGGHRLVVFYFEGEVGDGKISWADVTAQSQLRDAVIQKRRAAAAGAASDASLPTALPLTAAEQHCFRGLGGSQKAEVAWLDEMGYKYEERDVSSCRSRTRAGRLSSTCQLDLSLPPMQMTAAAWRENTGALLKVARQLDGQQGFLDCR